MKEKYLIDTKKCKTELESKYLKEFNEYKEMLKNDKDERIKYVRELQRAIIKGQYEVLA
jgi:hypothetical protein